MRRSTSSGCVSSGALREGLLYDLLGRIRHEDVRDLTIRCPASAITSRSSTPRARANRAQVPWRTARGSRRAREPAAPLLRPACTRSACRRLHRYYKQRVHRRSQQHAGLLGRGSHQLASLILAHRRKIPPAVSLDAAVRRAVVPLRLAVCLNRNRSPHLRDLPRAVRLRGLRSVASGWLTSIADARGSRAEAERLATRASSSASTSIGSPVAHPRRRNALARAHAAAERNGDPRRRSRRSRPTPNELLSDRESFRGMAATRVYYDLTSSPPARSAEARATLEW